MAQLVVPSAVLIRLIWAVSGTPFAVNVLGARKSGASTIDQTLTNTIGTAIKGSFTAGTLDTRLNSVVSLATVAIRDISAPNLPEFRDSGGAAASTGSAGLLPPQVALCATLRTAKAGKNYRGRYYQGGWDQSQNTATGTAAAAASTDLLAFLTAVQGNLTASGLTLAIVSRTLAQVTDVTGIQVRDSVWDTIRKRATPGI